MKKKFIVIFVLLFLFWCFKFVLIDYSYIPKKSEFSIDLKKVRTLAASKTNLPMAINCLFTAEGELISWTIMAGDNSVPNHYIQTSFQICYKDRTIILDTPMDEEQVKEFRYANVFFKDNYQILQKAIKEADLLIFTHEHLDHIGGLAKSPYLKELAGKVIFTEEQIRSPLFKKADFPSDFLRKIEPIKYDKYYLVAPGIVLIKAPGHTPGHQMVFIKLQNGKEFLFAGDAIWNFANIRKEKARPILVYLIGRENPRQIGDQIRHLAEIFRKDKHIHIVPNHDIEVFQKYFKEGILGETFIE